ncbi:MAG: Fic family protein [Cyanobacteria bacterium J06639_14]
MTEFMGWLNSDVAHQLHPIDSAAEAHCRFVSIHPFRDGNGRTGWLLMNLLLLRQGYPVVVITNQQRAAYIEALAEAQQQDSLLGLQELLLDAAQVSLVDVLRVVVTATENSGKGEVFYNEILTFLKNGE